MTYSLITGVDNWIAFSTINGFKLFREWVETFELDTHFELRHFVEYGWSQELDELSENIRLALTEKPPLLEDTKNIVETLLETVITSSKNSESIRLANGLVEP